MNYALSASTRSQLDLYMAHQASLNGLPVTGLAKNFAVDPAVQQRLENAVKNSTELTQKSTLSVLPIRKVKKSLLTPPARLPAPTAAATAPNAVTPSHLTI